MMKPEYYKKLAQRNKDTKAGKQWQRKRGANNTPQSMQRNEGRNRSCRDAEASKKWNWARAGNVNYISQGYGVNPAAA